MPMPMNIFDINIYFHSLNSLLSSAPQKSVKNQQIQAQLPPRSTSDQKAEVPSNTALPIDNHRKSILKKIQKDRVVIIHGGKNKIFVLCK